MPARFPYVPVPFGRGDTFPMPLVPMSLKYGQGEMLSVQGLLDSGAVNVLPFRLGLRVGAVWERQTKRVNLTGNLAALEARALVLTGQLADYPPVQLVFAWSKAEAVPLLLGQVNFFQVFDVCFQRSRFQIEIQPAAK